MPQDYQFCHIYFYLLFRTACRANVMWTFFLATRFANTAWHNIQCIMRLTLRTAGFTCFTSWCCHFIILFNSTCYILFYYSPNARKSLPGSGIPDPTIFFPLDVQQLLVFATFASNFFSPFFFFGDFTDTADIGTCSNWNQTTND